MGWVVNTPMKKNKAGEAIKMMVGTVGRQQFYLGLSSKYYA